MYFGFVEPELAFAMIATVVTALACTCWTRVHGRRLADDDRRPWRRAILHSTPALGVGVIAVAMLLACLTLPRTPHWHAWGWWWIFGGLLLHPLATAVALAGACRNWQGLPRKPLIAMRASTVLAALLTWIGTLMNMPST